MPKYAVAFMIFTMANVGLPGTSGFVGEFLTLVGVFRANTLVALFAATGVILSAAYALWLYRRVIFGALEKESLKAMLDLSTREKVILYPLVALTIFFGVYPAPVFDATAASVDLLSAHRDARADPCGRRAGAAHDWRLLGRQVDNDGHRPCRCPPARRRSLDHFRPGIGRCLRRCVHRRFLRQLHEGAGADRFHHRHDPRCRPGPLRADRPFRISGAAGSRDAGHPADDLGQQPDLALHGAGTAVAGALCRLRHQPREPALHGSRPEVLRSRRALLRHAALRHVAGLWFHRQYRLYRNRPGSGVGNPFARPRLRSGLCSRRPRIQDFGRAVPHVDAGRAPTPVTAFLSAAPKIGAMAIFVRIVVEAFQPVFADWQQIVVFISIASMLLGSFAAIGQKNIKRLMAYSSIGHMGYALVGLAAGTQAGISGVILYMTIYMVMTLGTFACILSMRRKEIGNVENVEDLAGLSSTNPFMAVVLTILMFSLAGIPPLAGFFGKYYVFLAAIEAKLYPLAVIGVIGSVVGAYYYIRIVKVMWFDEAKGSFERPAGELKVVYALSGLFVVAFVVFGGALGNAVTVAAKTFF
ncbi:hypothetical protein Lal_00010528 [Lupinus albus]|nr:hypothetical protein Lal_00010528 [Lupinus albus]